MGTLRTIYALSVVFAHSWPNGMVFVGGQNAVQLFYIISGFLISYVLVESKSYSRVSTFYVNRYLRLYPIYFVVAVLALFSAAVAKQSTFLSVYSALPLEAILLLVLSNVFLFGQDWVLFSGVHNNHFVLTSDFSKSDVLLYQGLLVPQGWTLGVELSFYLVAPFILPRRKLIYGFLLCSLALRAYLISEGLGMQDPWTYRFFPTELALFLLGALSHQVLLPLYRKHLQSGQFTVANYATHCLIALSLVYFAIPLNETYKSLVLFATFILLVPLTFIFQSRHRFDNWIGNLSYPIYICHVFVIGLATSALREAGIDDYRLISIASVLLTVLFAILLNSLIGSPFERIRNSLKLSQRKSTHS